MKIKMCPHFISHNEQMFAIAKASNNHNMIFNMSERLIDIAVYRKAMSNGYPMAAIIGKRDVIDASQNTFISSMY